MAGFGVIGFYILIGFLELKVLIKKGYWIDVAAYSVILLLSFAIIFPLSIGMSLPSPVKPIEGFITMIFGK